ncbi:hypothetical protein [Anaerocellum danielii]|uniref:AbrB family transcriptional regulator n=1 Tax=Anaerocellum danielii TaxID=1387557 RepID=A0ABZ0U5T0_9FIRM|nr:hypothetical protein [Caldicellulosiruptor danielii]WPX09095.1 hypothetical protein SOJ16_000269 [Caldicellulosiruptor danielii]
MNRKINKVVILAVSELIKDIDNVRKISIPVDTIKYIIEKLGNDIIWDYDYITGELIIMKRPESYVDTLAGLGQEIWEGLDSKEFIEEMREEWEC